MTLPRRCGCGWDALSVAIDPVRNPKSITTAADAKAAPPLWEVAPASLRLGPGDVHVWRIALDEAAAHARSLATILADDETKRAAAFRFPRDRDRFVMTRGALRMVLARYVDRDARHLCFAYDAHEKPALVLERSHESLRFNVSHSADLALVAVTLRRAVGIDVERIRDDIEVDGIAREFGPREMSTLQGLSGETRIRAFFACWTRKEAYLKALGTGLARRLDDFEVSVTPGTPAALLADRDDPGNVERWCLRDLRPAPDYAAALAVQGHGWRLTCWQWDDVDPAPLRRDR